VLSYRHEYHAGSPADVLKHATFAFALAYATRKPRPLYVLDTHAGAGAYDLSSPRALKTGEAQAGIARLRDAPRPWPDLLAPYLDLLATVPSPTFYPGSPLIAKALLRPGDRLDLVELHTTDHAALEAEFRDVRGARVTRDDGLALLIARVPPPERRAVVLIDPSYEVKTDYEAVVDALAAAHHRFPTGTYLLWYPVIERARTLALLDALTTAGVRSQYRIELCTAPDGARRGLTGSGLVAVNPPWTLPAAAEAALPWLAERLGASGPLVAEWLVPE
jgi:23S rRNA (adenine2030-N6)-methyltransferase